LVFAIPKPPPDFSAATVIIKRKEPKGFVKINGYPFLSLKA
jgi:hypothetical protein